MCDYTIGEAAEALGVTPKALRHWEGLGLLTPSRTSAGYRSYTDTDLERGAAIALYRGVGIPLVDIATLIDAPSHTLLAALKRHQFELQRQQSTLNAQIDAVDQLIAGAQHDTIDMDAMVAYLGQNMPQYQQEAQSRWGDTAEWAQSQQRLSQLGTDDFARLEQEQQAFATDLIHARDAGVAPLTAPARTLVQRHRDMISQWYEATPSRQLILARMYVADPRFHAAYGGAQGYLLELVEAQARADGVDVADPQWD